MAHRSTSTNAGSRRGLWLLAIALVLATAVARPQNEEPAPVDPAALRRRTAELERLLEAATGEAFYLVLDVPHSKLALMLGGVALQDYEILAAAASVPRVLWRRGLPPGEWHLRIWSGGQLDPPPQRERLEIVASADGTGDAPAMPSPPPPDTTLVGAPYLLRYEEGLALEIHSVADDRRITSGSWLTRLGRTIRRDWKMLWGREPLDPLRLRLDLHATDADHLYESLPPDTRLVIVAEPPAP